MRLFAALYLLPPALTSALQLPNFQDLVSRFSITFEDFIPPAFASNASETEGHDLLKRQFSNTCPQDFRNCANLGAPGLCCASAAVCSADAAGNVACCPTGAECSGTIGGVITAGTVNSVGSVIHGTNAAGATTSSFVFAGTTTGNGLVPANAQTTATSQNAGAYHPTTTTGGGFVVNGGSTVATPGAAVRGADIVCIRLPFGRLPWGLTGDVAIHC